MARADHVMRLVRVAARRIPQGAYKAPICKRHKGRALRATPCTSPLVQQLQHRGGVSPCTCLVTNCQVSQKAVCFCYNNINGSHMASSGCSGPIFLVISLEVVGRDTGSTLAALVSVIYDASTRAVVIDSLG
jgi:hypothetical protein